MMRWIFFCLCHFKGSEYLVSDRHRVREALQSGSILLVFIVAKVTVGLSRRQNGVVVRERDARTVLRFDDILDAASTAVTVPSTTVVLRLFRKMLRIGEAICPGASTEVAT